MLTEEAIVEIKVLAKRGYGIRRIAREMGVSRNTVRRYLRGDTVKTESDRRPGRPRLLAAYEGWLVERIEAARPIRLPATVLHREVKAMGFAGSERTVRRFVSAQYPDPEPEPIVRFETVAGHQAQMDWGTYRVGGKRVYAFIGVLGYSRWLYVEYVTSMASEVLIACHQRMFAHFGGIPAEVLYDNMKTVVTQRDAYGRARHRFHDAIWDLAKMLGFRPRLCRPYRPQTKGKVERSVDYVAQSFFHPLVTRLAMEGVVPDIARLNAEVLLWLGTVANVRTHGTTKEKPVDRLVAEREAMTAYALPPQVASDRPLQWPRYTLQRSPREYDAVLQELSS